MIIYGFIASMCVFPICEAHLSVAKLLLQYGALSKCKDEVRVVHRAITKVDEWTRAPGQIILSLWRGCEILRHPLALSGWIYCVGTV